MKNNSEILIKFGERVRDLRIQKGLSQEQLAHIVNVHRTYIGMIERSEKNITLLNIEKIAKGLNMSVHELLINNG
ncbi:MAG: helix-turn-helix transcriptional regulator [Flavobacteriaceae bacterium]|jgi:transcriptional regulator with XRE-family HTH domain|nr:helix-turn-helix transcriptional regulator [Flavobacteriaceae bacterium]